jgi:hypothetical protein
MKSLSPPNLLSRSLIGAVGLGVALLGLPQSAKAININRGTDYVATPSGGALFNFVDPLPGVGVVTVNFKGLAIGTPTDTPPDGGNLGQADTVINRLQNVNTPSGTTLIEIVGLSLQNDESVTVNGAKYDVFAGLQKYYNGTTSTGEMTIRHEFSDDNPTQGTWDSNFIINGVAIFATEGTLTPTGTDYVKGLIQGCNTATNYQCILFDKGPFVAINQPWSHTPIPDQLQGDNLVAPGLEQNFYMTQPALHDAGDGNVHNVQPTPVPWETDALSVIGSTVLFGFGLWAKSKSAKSNKNIDLD